MVVALALLLSAAFGAGDQYLGSGHVFGLGWPTEVSLLSAPWLLLAFVAGCTQRDPRRAALLGFGCTAAALEQLQGQGIEPEREPYRVREGGSLLCFVRDPDGYRIELIDRSGK